jgi:hypothetical protein
MRANITSNPRGQIHDAVNLKEKIEALNKEIAMLLGRPALMSNTAPIKTKMRAAQANLLAPQKRGRQKLNGANHR